MQEIYGEFDKREKGKKRELSSLVVKKKSRGTQKMFFHKIAMNNMIDYIMEQNPIILCITNF